MASAITAIGTATPPFKRRQLETAELIAAGVYLRPAEKRFLNSIYKATEIEYRHSVLSDYCATPGEFEFFPNEPHTPFPTTSERMLIYKKNALPLALSAIKNCFNEASDFDTKNITHLITVSCTGMYAPGIDIEIIQQLKLKSTIQRTAINFMGCYGAFNGLKIADAICNANPDANVLMVCVELCTIHFQHQMTKENILANALFADGAAAVIVQRSNSQQKRFELSRFHCDLLPQSTQEMAWHIADSGFDIVLSAYVPEIIESGIASFIETLLNQHMLSLSAIDFYAIHPGGVKILQACEKALGLHRKQNHYAYHILKNYGNMSSATILFVLHAIWNDLNENDDQKNIFSCAFGPGLTLESMLLKTHL